MQVKASSFLKAQTKMRLKKPSEIFKQKSASYNWNFFIEAWFQSKYYDRLIPLYNTKPDK